MILTVVLITYNAMPYLKDCVTSILEQTYTDFRFIIADDGSTDNTEKYLKTITDTRINYIKYKHRGLINTFNEVLHLIDTDFFTRIDADDIYLPNKFKLQIEELTCNTNLICCGTESYYMKENGQILNKKITVKKSHSEIIDSILRMKRGVIGTTIMYKTDIIKKENGYRPNIYPEEYDLVLRISKYGEITNILESLSAYRLHKSFSQKNLHKIYKSYILIITKHYGSITKLHYISLKMKSILIIIKTKIKVFIINNIIIS